jgi:AcrR family transcriptional regulator
VPLEPLTPDRRRAMTRSHLLAAAAEVFADRGYHAATLDEVAEAAGFTKGAVYSNFSSKEDLFLALSEEREQRLISAFAAAARPDLDPLELVQSLRSVYAGTDLEDRDRNWRLLTEFTLYSLRSPDARKKLVDASRAGVALVVELVEHQCQVAGVIPPIPAELIARIYIALFTGLWQQQATDQEAVDDDAFAAAAVFIAQAVAALGTPEAIVKRRKTRRPSVQ